MAIDNDKVATERRRFLESCGRFAVVTPPTVALMLSAPGSVRAALAASGGSTSSSATTQTDSTQTVCQEIVSSYTANVGSVSQTVELTTLTTCTTIVSQPD